MKILLIHQYFLEKGDGGGSRFNEMTKNWSAQGHEITVLAGMVHYATGKKQERYKGKFTYQDKSFYENVDVVRCYVSESYNINFLGRLWAYFSFVFSSIYAGFFKTKGKFDVIVVTSPPLFVGITAYVLSKLKRSPFVFEIRDLWPESAIDTGVLKNKFIIKFAYWFEKFIYSKARLINVLTPAFRDKLVNEKQIPKEKVIFIPNAADFSLAKKVQQNFNATEFKRKLNLEDKFVITYVGAHGVANHLIQIINAAERLLDTNVVFQLIGAGMRKEYLIKVAEEKGLTNVVFRDSVPKEEVFKYILASDVGASVLKKVDTFKTIYSNKTFDYMSCKKPILLAIDGVSKDLINDAKCGVYVEPESIEAIVEGVRFLLAKTQEEIHQMGVNGYLYAKSHFDRNQLATKYLQKINEIIK
ncbi:glycosyltransferase family 4 protein [Polaribacter batillariae]|uniref:Glycosyltransferase family 4 protein n=1 Tax=Polaribacter batillariae TaxID=2808900 RepID=A0ABX7SST9_9FLAO|nr:glycosyltransferase family 4 protein [Polaribacter batillariae]QTD37310.1 glycosyltransferase family 4 protein [Polaribacter batillariae]